MKMTAAEIAAACGGTILCGNPQTVVTSFFTDSRETCPDGFFVPIKGERTDAHVFIDATLQAGAAGSFTQGPGTRRDDRVLIRVDDTLRALQDTAKAWRQRFSLPVVGITGSVGKTTTKEMVALALSSAFCVMRTRGNQNSQVGLPLTLFQLSEEHDCAVVEMGMSNFGEMGRLSEIACPTMAVMTNIGVSHIAYLKTQENILAEKLHITDRFTSEQPVFINGDDKLLRGLLGQVPLRLITFGLSEGCEYRAFDVQQDETGVRFTLQTPTGCLPVSVPAPGLHNVRNAAVSIAVAETLGADPVKAAKSLASYEPPAMRQQILRAGDVTVVDDCYNASPDSMRSSLQLLMGMPATGRRIAVLGDMLELGAESHSGHYGVGQECVRCGVDVLLCVGPEAAAICEGARDGQTSMTVRHEESNETVIAWLHENLKPGDTVLVKGSRGMHMEEIVRALLQRK